MKALRNPSAMLVNMAEDLPDNYQTTLYEAKMTKSEISRNKVLPTYFNIVLTRKLFTGLFSSCVICARLHLQAVSIPLEFAQINFCIKRIIYKTFIFTYSYIHPITWRVKEVKIEQGRIFSCIQYVLVSASFTYALDDNKSDIFLEIYIQQ